LNLDVGVETRQTSLREGIMESRAKLFGHPIHQALIAFPLGLLAMAVIFDFAAIASNNPYWAEIAYWMMASGLITALIAAPFGVVDWLAIPSGTRAKTIGGLHGGGNLLVIILFGCSWLIRREAPASPDAVARVLSFTGGLLALGTGWLGGELVDRLGIGVDDGANPNAPSSLSVRHVRT
jgi:uncharacterized membrane protein